MNNYYLKKFSIYSNENKRRLIYQDHEQLEQLFQQLEMCSIRDILTVITK